MAMLLDPVRRAQLIDLRPLESARMVIVNVLQSGGDFQLRRMQPRRHRPIFFPDPLPFHQQTQAALEIQLADIRLTVLFFQGQGHALQPQGLEFFQGLSQKHKSFPRGSGVIVAPADVLVRDRGKGQLQFLGLMIQAVFQNGFDALVGTGSQPQRPAAGGFQALRAPILPIAAANV